VLKYLPRVFTASSKHHGKTDKMHVCDAIDADRYM